MLCCPLLILLVMHWEKLQMLYCRLSNTRRINRGQHNI
jgi:hypothetical protein